MAKQYWMISNRDNQGDYLGPVHSSLSYWVWRKGPLDDLHSWRNVKPDAFKKSIASVADAFPAITDPAQHEKQKHVTLFIHGYNNDWKDAVRRYEQICQDLFKNRETTDKSDGDARKEHDSCANQLNSICGLSMMLS